MNESDERYGTDRLTRMEMIEALGRHSEEGLGAGSKPPPGLEWVSMPPDPKYYRSPISRHTLLEKLHLLLKPRTYLEIGVNQGMSLQLSRTRTIAVDPSYRITAPIACDLKTFLTTSDEFFARADAFDHFDGVPIDLAFIDGMHLAEFALRDFVNSEKRSHPGGVIVLDDMLPRSSLEAYRIRRTRTSWTGDVFKVHFILSRYRPDLTLIPVNTSSTGSYIVTGLDPSNTVIEENYREIESFLTSKDPQEVPDDWLHRRQTYNAQALIESDIWGDWIDVRSNGGNAAAYAPLLKRLVSTPRDNV
jgi:predicted O-methyltransferase YrrM